MALMDKLSNDLKADIAEAENEEKVAVRDYESLTKDSAADKEAEMLVLHRRLAIAETARGEVAAVEPGSERGAKKQRTSGPPAEDAQRSQADPVVQARQEPPLLELDLAIQEVERRDKLIASLERYVMLPCHRQKKAFVEVWRANPLR